MLRPMSKPIYLAIGAAVGFAAALLFTRTQPAAPIPAATARPAAEVASPAVPAVANGTGSTVATKDSSGPARSTAVPDATVASTRATETTTPANAGAALPIDVSPGFEYLSKPASEMKDTDGMWGPWRRHQKLSSEPRDEEWAPRMEAALRGGIEGRLMARGMDPHHFELPVIECRTNACEIQGIGYQGDGAKGAFDLQDAVNEVLAGVLGSEFDLDERSAVMTSRPDTRVTYLLWLPRKGV